MNTSTVNPIEIEETTPAKLRVHIDELKQTKERLNGSLVDSRQRYETLMAERDPLVYPARVQKSVAAQKRLNAIDEERAVLKRDIADDETALREVEAQLIAAQNAIELAEWEDERAEARKLLTRRMKINATSKLQKAVEDLVVAIKAAKEEDERTFIALTRFSPNMERTATPIRSMGRLRNHVFSFQLEGLLLIDSRQLNRPQLVNVDIEAEDRKASQTALESLDSLELIF